MVPAQSTIDAEVYADEEGKKARLVQQNLQFPVYAKILKNLFMRLVSSLWKVE